MGNWKQAAKEICQENSRYYDERGKLSHHLKKIKRQGHRWFFRSIQINCIIDKPMPAVHHLLKDQWASHLAHAVVCELDVSFMIQEDVVQLQIPVDDALFMQEVQSDADFSSIKSVKDIHKGWCAKRKKKNSFRELIIGKTVGTGRTLLLHSCSQKMKPIHYSPVLPVERFKHVLLDKLF